MNRIRSVASSVSDAVAAQMGWQPTEFSRSEICSQTAFFVPVQYEPNYQYPLVVWLHGDGQNHNQSGHVISGISVQNYVGLGVCGPKANDSIGHSFRWPQNRSGILNAEQSIFDAIESAKCRFSVDHRRIFLAGYREGGTMAYRVALRNTHAIAGAISLGGGFPTGDQPLVNLHQARDVPLLMMRGASESHYTTEDLCDHLRVLHSAKLSIDIRQYDLGDELDRRILSDVNEWIMGRVTGNDTLQASLLSDSVPVEFSCN